MKIKSFRKMMVIAIIFSLIGISLTSLISGGKISIGIQNDVIVNDLSNDSFLSFYTFGKSDVKQKDVLLPKESIKIITDRFEELQYLFETEPFSKKTQKTLIEFIDLLDFFDLIPDDLSKDDVFSLVNPPWVRFLQKILSFTDKSPFLRGPTLNKLNNFANCNLVAQETSFDISLLCNIASVGVGVPLPFFMLPRPRGVCMWAASNAATAVGSLLQTKNYVAHGIQQGVALGFVGFGLSAFFGWFVYGLVGYATVLFINAEEFEYYTPPNNAPEISDESPSDGAVDVPVSLKDLSFRISDADGDRMSYSVSTSPNVGSGSGILKKNGVYSVPVSGLVGNTEYTWMVSVSDKYETVEKTFSFTTEIFAPVVSNPSPKDGSYHIPVDLDHLSVELMDFQGESMDFSIETSPDIGSGGGSGVENGVYTISINGLEMETKYTWYVNVTDGTYWTYEVFNFKTQVEPGPWWDQDWSFRKYLGLTEPSSDYQIVLQVWKEDGYDNVEYGVVDCEGHCNVDFSDIRFVSFNGEVCDYWIEEIGMEDGDHFANIWVKTASSGDEQLYLYYGNPYASSISDGTSTFEFFDDFDSYQEGKNNPGDWSIKTCSFETSCSVICNKTNAYSDKCLDVSGVDATSNSPKNEYSVAKNTINLAYGTYEIRVYMKSNKDRPEAYGYVRKDGDILISKNDWGDWWLGTAVFSDDVTDIELVNRFNQLWNGHVNVFFDNLFIKKYQTNEPIWSYFGEEEHSP